MNIQNKEQWESSFIEACLKGNLKKVRHLCEKQYLDLGWADIHFKDEWSESGFLLRACKNGHLEVVKYLLTSNELIEAGHTFADLHSNEEEGFRMACTNGHLEVVKYLLTSPELIEAGHTFADLHSNEEEGFRMACFRGHLDIVKYLLTSPELKEAGHAWADLHARSDEGESGFLMACFKGHLDVVKYLLTSHEMMEAGHDFADVHANEDEGFFDVCKWNHWNVVRWLVMDYGIEKTPFIEKIIEDYAQAQEYFRVREECKELNGAMKCKDEKSNEVS